MKRSSRSAVLGATADDGIFASRSRMSEVARATSAMRVNVPATRAVPLPVGELTQHGEAGAQEREHRDPAGDGATVHDDAPSRVERTATSPVVPSTLTIEPSG